MFTWWRWCLLHFFHWKIAVFSITKLNPTYIQKKMIILHFIGKWYQRICNCLMISYLDGVFKYKEAALEIPSVYANTLLWVPLSSTIEQQMFDFKHPAGKYSCSWPNPRYAVCLPGRAKTQYWVNVTVSSGACETRPSHMLRARCGLNLNCLPMAPKSWLNVHHTVLSGADRNFKSS